MYPSLIGKSAMTSFCKVSLLLLLTMFACVSCKHDDPAPTPDYSRKAPHTFIMYLVGDNNLDSDLNTNAKDAVSAIKEAKSGDINLVIYKDVRKHNPELFWVRKKNEIQVDTVYIKKYDDKINSAAPETLLEVLNATFDFFPETQIAGLSFGSHALGWTPSPRFAATRFIGQDEETGDPSINADYMELWQLDDVLKESRLKLDYFILDACNMANIETFYQLRNDVKYMLAAVTEIPAKGFPYKNIVSHLMSVSNLEQFKNCLTGSAQDFLSFNGVGTISVIDMSEVENVAQTFFSLLQNSPKFAEYVALLSNKEAAEYWQRNFQQFGRNNCYPNPKSKYYFYDLLEFAEYLANDDYDTFRLALDKMVVANNYTDTFLTISISRCCGVTISHPALFPLSENVTPQMMEQGYAMTDWGREMNKILKNE